MRSCTATITEIAYNTSPEEGEKYRAEIHFVTREDWAKELRVMFADMSAEHGSLGSDPTIGAHDSNAARPVIASKYIEECSGLWVVAPITRAVDDKVARDLLGDSFKRQLQLDGTYLNIAVVCSKADDISVTEILKSLDEDEEAVKLNAHAQILEPERDKLQEEVDALKGRLSEVTDETEELRTEIDTLRAAMDCSDEDELIIFSPTNPRKRLSPNAALKSRKRIRNL
ncbi:hypothetical protein VTH82DRAFT_1133 [Thermothelomyces myriococcoides]